MVLVLGLILYPVVYSGWLSFHNKHAYLPIETFIGFSNFAAMFSDGEFWRSIELGAIYGIGSVGLQILVGVSAALLLNETFIGRTFIRGVALFPYMVPTVVVVILMKWILNDAYGVLPYILDTIGIGEDILWLDTGHVMLTVILISTWTFFPFVVIGTLARLQTIDPELYAAAKVDGAGVVRRFIHVTLPQLRNVLFVVILLRFMFMFTQVRRHLAPERLERGRLLHPHPPHLHLHQDLRAAPGRGGETAMSMFMFLMLVGFAMVYFRVFRRDEDI